MCNSCEIKDEYYLIKLLIITIISVSIGFLVDNILLSFIVTLLIGFVLLMLLGLFEIAFSDFNKHY